MRKISAILAVYNEEFLLPYCLKGIDPYVDEIVVVDGSPTGPSTDTTANISKSFAKVKYLSGTFKTMPGAWDTGSQKNLGISEATGDVFLLISADMMFANLEHLCNVIRNESALKVFFCPIIEFWMDTKHIRMYGDLGNISLPGAVQEAVAISRDYQPMGNEYGCIEIQSAKPKEQVMISDTYKFHFGWVRSFPEQVAKHLRHVRQGRWGEEGTRLLNGAEQKLEQWAILHVLSYKQVPSVELRIGFPEEFEPLLNMNYITGQEQVIENYKKKYGTTPFRGVRE